MGSNPRLVSRYAPLVPQKSEKKMKLDITLTLEEYKLISRIKIYKSYPEVGGEYRFGIKTTGEDTRYHPVWAKNEDDAFEKSYKEYLVKSDYYLILKHISRKDI